MARRGRRNQDTSDAQKARRAQRSAEVKEAGTRASTVVPNGRRPRSVRPEKFTKILEGPRTPVENPTQIPSSPSSSLGDSVSVVTNVTTDRTRRTPRTSARPTGKVGDAGILAGTAVEESPEDRSRRMSEVTKELEGSLSVKDAEMAAAAEALKNKPSVPATSLRPTSDLPEAPEWVSPIRNHGIRVLHDAPFVCASCKLLSTHSGGVHISNQPACTICTDQGRPNIRPHQPSA